MSKKTLTYLIKLICIISAAVIVIFAVVGGIVWRINKKEEQSSNNSSQNSEPPDEPNDDDPSSSKKDDNDDQNEEGKDCPYLNETIIKLPSGKYGDGEAYLTEFKKIPCNFVVKLWKKGYHWMDIIQLQRWKIPETDIPDLKAEKRTGVIRELAIIPDFEKLSRGELDFSNPNLTPYKGVSRNLIVVVRKIPNNELKINLDNNIQEAPIDFESDKNATRNYIQELVNFTLSQEKSINPKQYEISLLWSLGIENFQKEEEIGWGGTSGSSAGSAIYLALISAFHQKNISHKVCATGTIKMNEEKVKNLKTGQEVILKKGDNLPIGGLKAKATGAAEVGLNQLVLSKYHSSPNILTKPSKKDSTKNITSADYQQVVPAEVKSKLTVHWTENIKDLRELIFQNKL
ncbi:MAG: hypothetical protein MRERC_1c092 [Mycoplasmataceae bacterium RC_NB112A]|nr:MAG: hypothetical protein MRERC_1c092 [Mycoplasmataceae bacterium RC_NB112A]